MTISFYPDLVSLSRAAAQLFVQQSRRAFQHSGRFCVAVSGGQTPRLTYELLAQQPFRNEVPWGDTQVFWVDERCVALDDPRSNQRMVRQALLDRVAIPSAQIHPIICSQSPQQAAKRYEALLRTFFKDRQPRFDLVLLGLGENGHTASLFPRTPVLEERERWVAEAYVAEQEMHRVTLTVPIINRASVVAFLISGSAKAQVLQRLLAGPFAPDVLPAQLIRPESGALLWLVDEDAGRLIRQKASRNSTSRSTS